MKNTKRILSDQSGQAVLMAAFALLALLAVLGLAVDVGRLVVVKAQLSKAVDAGALSGARILPTGRNNAENAAHEYAQMNFASGFLGTTAHDFMVSFSPDPTRPRVHVDGTALMPTTFLRVVGLSDVTVKASAEAERRPLSVAMVLDVTESLGSVFNGVDAIGYLRNAAAQFVGYFDDNMDKMSLTAFSTGTVLYSPLDHGFTSRMTGTISSMTEHNFTNLSDGLISGRKELRNDADPSSFKALVFFTDGRPTALRGVFPINGAGVDAVITGKQDPVSGSVYPQLYRIDRLHEAIPGVSYTATEFPNGLPKTVANLQSQANQNLRQAAAVARRHDITIFTIGLGNPRASQTWKQPDARLLIEIANAREGVVDPETMETITNPAFDPEQPEGRFYFAPDAEQLDAIFEQVAREIVLRLTQ